MSLSGEFTVSEFVKKTTGADNVCERSALLGAGPDGTLLVKKTVKNGMTLAAAEKFVPWKETQIMTLEEWSRMVDI